MFSDRLKELRKNKKITQVEFAKVFNISNGTIALWETNKRTPDIETIKKLADYFNVSVDYLVGRSNDTIDDDVLDKVALIDNDLLEQYGNIYHAQKAQYIRDLQNQYTNIHPVKLKKIPMLGEIACGKPIFADEDKEHYVMCDMDIKADFCLMAKGDSMINARIHEGDIVFIREQPIVENGDIAAVIIGDEATLKRWYYNREQNKLILNSENPTYEPLVYIGDELEDIKCLGKAVYFMSAI